MISYQGKLLQPSGAVVPDGTYSMQFAIYDVPTGGTALWSETNPSVAVKGGLFSVLLGSVVNLPSNIFDNPSRFFGVKVGSDPEMTPRQQIASSAFAFRSAVAGTVDDGAITTSKLADGAVTEAKIADGVISTAKISDGAVTTAKIADSSITSSKLTSDISIPGVLQAASLAGEWDKSSSNYIRLGDVQIAWGIGGDGPSPETITLPAAFAKGAVDGYVVTITSADWPCGSYSLDWNNKTRTSFTIQKYNCDGSAYTGPYMHCHWIAIGKWR